MKIMCSFVCIVVLCFTVLPCRSQALQEYKNLLHNEQLSMPVRKSSFDLPAQLIVAKKREQAVNKQSKKKYDFKKLHLVKERFNYCENKPYDLSLILPEPTREKSDCLYRKNLYKRTALHLAIIENNQSETFRLISNYRVNLNVQDCFGLTPLYFAVLLGSIPSITFLLQQGANPNTKELSGTTLLKDLEDSTFSTYYKHVPETTRLDDVEDLHGNTPLHKAVQMDFVPIAKLLLKYNAFLDIKNDDGKKPCQLIQSQNMFDLFEAWNR